MGVRSYGPAVKPKPAERPVDELESQEDKQAASGYGWQIFLAAVLMGFILIGGLFYFILFYYFDITGGESTPEQMAVSFVGSLTDSHPDAVLSYCIPKARQEGVLSDNMDITNIRRLSDERHISFLNRSIKSMDVLPENDVQALEQGIQELYGANVRIKDARRILVSTDMEWLDEDGVPQKEAKELTVIGIQVHMKWYVYTGRPLSEADVMKIALPVTEEETETIDVDTPVLFAPEPEPEPFVREPRELLKKEGLRKELESGKVEIEGFEQVMPAPYENLKSLFVIKPGSEADGISLKPDEVLSNPPVEMVNDRYSQTGVYVSIANTGAEEVSLEEGMVVSLFLSVPDEKHDGYPEVWLPGNVTFGTLYMDVADLYGDMEPYGGNNPRVEVFEDTDIYSVQIGTNRHNRLYLYFREGKVWAMQWDYYDFNAYTGDIA